MRWLVALCCFCLFAGVFLVLPAVAAAEDTVCIQCHSGQSGRLAAPVKEWRTSVHAANRISCNDCHGGDPTDFNMAMSPDRGFIGAPEYADVPKFCGRCHVGVEKDYLSSAHGQALQNGGPQCVVCHGNHAIQLASIDLINKESCSRCHSYERAKLVKQAISDTEATLQKLENSVDSLHRLGIDVTTLKDDLFAKRNSFRRLFHTVNLEKIKAQTDKFDKELSHTKDQIAAHEKELRQRKLIGGGIVLLLLVGGGLALLLRRSYHKDL